MKIERIDDKTVKCFLSNEELEEYDIDYKDFVLRSEKAKIVVQDIMEQAEEEVGYKPPKFAFDLQIMMLPDQGLLLTFSEKDPADLKNGQQIMDCLKEMKEVLQQAREKVGITDNLSNITGQATTADASGKKEATGKKDTADKKDTAKKQTPQQVRQTEAIFVFDKLRNVMEFAAALPGNLRVSSALYEMENHYYLYLKKGTASYERYSRTCIQAMEFGRLYAAEPDRILYMEEHGQCLVAERALKKLRLD